MTTSPPSTPLPYPDRSPVPAPCPVPPFEPLRVRGGRQRLRRALRRRRRAPAAILAMSAAALAVAGGGEVSAGPPPPTAAREQQRAPVVRWVSAPVRIADAAAVRLLRPGDRVDVIAAPNSPTGVGGGGGGEARVVATGARVADVPRTGETRPDGGALVVLSVPRSTATALAGAGMTSQLAVTLC
ncbi:hypothetical protein ACFUJR_18170 [Streptomyces sp. NPDC057271]|uniref:hypothetical protein n=1 Tax=unclassified Streptomyces TaxID=2593676 RepID=UPI00363840FC